MRFSVTGLGKETLKKARQEHSTSQHKCKHWNQWLDIVDEALSDNEFRFSHVQRGFNWIVKYVSTSKGGNSATMELSMEEGEAVWSLVVTPARHIVGNIRVLMQKPIARCVVNVAQATSFVNSNSNSNSNSIDSLTWLLRLPVDHTFQVEVTGSGEIVPTWKNSIGILQHQEDVRHSTYTIAVPTEDAGYLTENIQGQYDLLSQCHSAENSLYVRRSTSVLPSMYMFLDPEKCGHADQDSVVFARGNRRALYGETRHVVSKLAPSWRPNHVIQNKNNKNNAVEKVSCITNGVWLEIQCAHIEAHESDGVAASVPSFAATGATGTNTGEQQQHKISLTSNSHERPTQIAACLIPKQKDELSPFSKLIANVNINHDVESTRNTWVTMKSRSRRSVWMNKGNIQAQRALSLAKSLATNNNTTFVYSSSNSEIVED